MAGKKKDAKEKPLEKMTAKDLRELAKDIPQIVGVHGMNKPELIAAVKEARGISDSGAKKADTTVRDAKKKIRSLKTKREQALEGDDRKMAAVYRRRISRMKKKTRGAA